MGFFDDFGKKVSDAGQKTLQKTKEISDTARINSLIADEEKKISNTYYQIGKLYMSVHRNDEEEEFSGMVNTVAESEQKIKDYRKQIQNIRGLQNCEKCGAEVAQGIAFCSSCGNPMPKAPELDDTDDYVKCGNCGMKVKMGMRFCTSCGEPMPQQPVSVPDAPVPPQAEIEEKVCQSCGAKQTEDSAFCTECGAKL